MSNGKEENQARDHESYIPKHSRSESDSREHSRFLRFRQVDRPERPRGQPPQSEPAPGRPNPSAGAHHPVAGVEGSHHSEQAERICGQRTRAAGGGFGVWSRMCPRGLPELQQRSRGMGRPDSGQQAGRTLRDRQHEDRRPHSRDGYRGSPGHPLRLYRG